MNDSSNSKISLSCESWKFFGSFGVGGGEIYQNNLIYICTAAQIDFRACETPLRRMTKRCIDLRTRMRIGTPLNDVRYTLWFIFVAKWILMRFDLTNRLSGPAPLPSSKVWFAAGCWCCRRRRRRWSLLFNSIKSTHQPAKPGFFPSLSISLVVFLSRPFVNLISSVRKFVAANNHIESHQSRLFSWADSILIVVLQFQNLCIKLGG